ncbi:MAG: hypothetical protein QM813_17590 [Verrucomicrobiota bacterium]
MREAAASKKFNAGDLAARFWKEKLLPAAEQTAGAGAVLDRIGSDPKVDFEAFLTVLACSRKARKHP